MILINKELDNILEEWDKENDFIYLFFNLFN